MSLGTLTIVTDASPKPHKFIWPPKPVSEAELGAPAQPEYWKPQPRREPPVIEMRPAAATNALRAAAPPRTAVAATPVDLPHPWSWRRQIETAWFGLTRATLAERAHDADWSPDPASAYCSKCGNSVGLHEQTADGCRTCRGKRLPWSRFIRLGEYHGLIREVVHEVKFTRWQRVVSAAQKEHVQDWLLKHYPVKTQAAAPPAPARRRQSSAS